MSGLRALAGAVLLAALLGACREGETGRRTDTSKGVYAGAADQVLDAATLDALRERARHQRF